MVDLAFIQSFLFYVNHVVLMLNSIFLSKICIGKQGFVVVAITALYVVQGFLYILR